MLVKRLNPNAPLYHWAPTSVRPIILLEGLMPLRNSQRGPSFNLDGSEWYAPWVCLGITPKDAYQWSNLPYGVYDLWQVDRLSTDKLKCRRDGGPYVIEVRIHNRILPNRLWLIGTKTVNRVTWRNT